MGGNMTRPLLEGGHHVVVYDPIEKAVEAELSLGDTIIDGGNIEAY